MANNYSDIKNLVDLAAGKNAMGLSNTIARAKGLPLDYSSIQETYEKAVIYAATNTTAYEGQIIAVTEGESTKDTTVYVITPKKQGTITISGTDYDIYIKKVGVVPAGSDSVAVTDDGVISIAGYAGAANGHILRKKADGTGVEWVSIGTLASLTDSKTVIQTATNSALSAKSEVDGDTTTYTLDVTIPTVEVPVYTVSADSRATGATSTTYRFKKDGADEGTAIVVPDAYDDTNLTTRVSAAEGSITDHAGRIAAMETFWSTTADSDGIVNKLKEIQDYIASDTTGAATMAGNIQTNTQAIATLNGNATTAGSVAYAVANSAIATNQVAGRVKASDEISVSATGAMTIVKVSTDALQQGSSVLVLDGGKSGYTPPENSEGDA